MLEIIVAVLIVVSLMLFLMFLMLKKITGVLNDKSKTYFINKIQNYDELIENRSKYLESLNKKIKELENIKIKDSKKDKKEDSNVYYDLITPSYQDEKVFKSYKKINERFNLENTEIIKKFIQEKVVDNNDNLYQTLLNIQKKIPFNDIYKLVLLDKELQLKEIKKILNEEEKELLEQYSQDNFNILEFKSYLEDLIRKEDPTIYIKVGSKTENYDSLNQLIKTFYDENIYTGILIIYKNKLYDYSLS